MSESGQHSVIQRILVALDASLHSEAALQAAARISSVFGATLSGVYVEDDDLLRAADLPFSREIRIHSAGEERLSQAVLRRQMRLQQFRAIRALERAADRYQLKHAFAIATGQVSTALIEHARAADLITLGQSSVSVASRGKLGSTARQLLTRAPASILLARRGLRLDLPVALLYDQRAPDREYALRLASELAEADFDSPLIILITGDPLSFERCSRDITGRMDPELWVTCERVNCEVPEHIAQLAHAHATGVLVLSSESRAASPDRLGRIASLTSAPLLVARAPELENGGDAVTADRVAVAPA